MSEVALYDLLRRIPEVSNDEAKAAVTDVAIASQVATKSDIKDMATKSDIKDMATKSDIKDMATKSDIAELKTDIAKLETELKYMQWFIAFGFSITIAILKLL